MACSTGCFRRITELVDDGELAFTESDSNRGIARDIVADGLIDDYSLLTISRTLSDWRREHSKSTGGNTPDADDEPEAETWNEWADQGNDDTGSSDNLDYRGRDYYYNDADDKYVLWPDHCAGSLVLDGQTYRDIREEYTDWAGDPSTISEICRAFGISRRDFVAIKRTFGFTHDNSPFTDEQLTDQSVSIDERIESLARKRERQLEKEHQKRQWADTQKDAKKWRRFKRDVVNPVIETIDRTPIERADYQYPSGDLSDFYFFPHTTDGHLDQLNADGSGFAENKRRWLDCLHKNIHRCGHFGRPQKTVITLGNDQFNIDDPQSATTAGTPQDNDIVGPNSFFASADAGIEAIEQCRKLSPVEVRVVPGNHDWRSAVAYYWGLQHKYSDIDNVTITGGAEKWQFETYGKNLVTWTHGDKVGGGETKQNWNLSSILLHECPRMVGEATHFYCFLGHLHHLLEKEDGVHTLQGGSTAKEDQWHKVGKHGAAHACQTAYVLAEDGGQKVRFTAEP